jgi:hypothetical protein
MMGFCSLADGFERTANGAEIIVVGFPSKLSASGLTQIVGKVMPFCFTAQLHHNRIKNY